MIEVDLDRDSGREIRQLYRYWVCPLTNGVIDMNPRKSVTLLALTLLLTCMSAQAVGFRLAQIPFQGTADMKVGLWYPTHSLAPSTVNADFGLSVTRDAPISGENGALVVISHGYSGWYGGHADTAVALAEAGFIVAAPSHSGNTWSDMSSSIDKWMLDRPAQVSRIIDDLLTKDWLNGRIDPMRIGVYGFSAGGFTALSLIGGVPDLDHAKKHCRKEPEEFVCKEGAIDLMIESGLASLAKDSWGYDSRIRSAVLSAPGFAMAYTRTSLAAITADIQLWSGELDQRVPTRTNAEWIASQLPVKPESHWVANATHFSFLVVPCREKFKRADPVEYQLICGDSEGFDRKAFHDDMHTEMIRFFKTSFGL